VKIPRGFHQRSSASPASGISLVINSTCARLVQDNHINGMCVPYLKEPMELLLHVELCPGYCNFRGEYKFALTVHPFPIQFSFFSFHIRFSVAHDVLFASWVSSSPLLRSLLRSLLQFWWIRRIEQSSALRWSIPRAVTFVYVIRDRVNSAFQLTLPLLSRFCATRSFPPRNFIR